MHPEEQNILKEFEEIAHKYENILINHPEFTEAKAIYEQLKVIQKKLTELHTNKWNNYN